MLKQQLNEEKRIHESWVNSSKNAGVVISKQIPHVKSKITGENKALTDLAPREISEKHFLPAALGYDNELFSKSKDWVLG